jgi:3-hydroxybutyryl-CoA dehydrogenase
MNADGNQQLSRVGIVGAGFMGSGIAESVAAAGLEVVLHEPEDGPLELSRENIKRSVERGVKGEKISAEEATAIQERLSWSTDLSALAEADLVIEAIAEVETLKLALFDRLDHLLPDEVMLASNTSSIPIAGLAAATNRPERVLGLHFFSPVPVMRLVEVVVGLETSDETVAAAESFAQKIGKKPIRTKDRSGFIVNFLLVPYLMAAVRMYEEGFASREDIDQGMKLGCGHPMGPLKLCDLIGLDVLHSVCESLYDEFKRDEYAPPPLLRRMIVSGHLGRKAGRGFYTYEESRSPVAAEAQ